MFNDQANIPRRSRHIEPVASRRDWLLRAGGGFGALALASLLGTKARSADSSGSGAPATDWSFPGRKPARGIIFIFLEGGPSHLDTFDPKPLLNRLAGQQLPPSFKPVITAMGEANAPLLECKRTWKRHGRGGLWVSDWLPNLASCADELTVLRSCWSNGLNHVGGVCQMNTGSTRAGRPSLGSWVTYGLGTENENLPAYVVMHDNPQAQVSGGPSNWGAGFMPATLQGTPIQGDEEVIANLLPPEDCQGVRQRQLVEYLGALNADHARLRPEQHELDARIRSFELAFRMQAEAPEAIDIASESAATKTLYGLDNDETATLGRCCLLARRLIERGVRFVQLYHGTGSKWDAHAGIEKNHAANCRAMDQPVAGLLRDLKARGLLDETLVLWGGEFGRTPMSEKGDGRDHNPYGFTMWLAGGGLPGGRTVGATDDLGLHAVAEPLHVHDLHATILALMGLEHTRLIYRHQGRPERATQNEGTVSSAVLGV